MYSRIITTVPMAAILSTLLAIPCWNSSAAEPNEPAQLVVRNAKVVTVDAKFSITDAVAVRDGKIVALGADAVKMIGSGTQIIDAKGKTVLPGLYDSHVHPV